MIRSRSWAEVGEGVVLYAGALIVSVLAAAFAANAEFVMVLGALCGLAALAVLASRVATLWFTILMGLVVVGVLQMYVPGAKYLKYVAPAAALAMLLHVFAELLARRTVRTPVTVPLFLTFTGIGLVSLAANWQSVGMAIVGLKAYYPMWGLFLGLAIIRWRSDVIDSMPRAALVLAFLQLPFVAHQWLHFVPMRQGLSGVVAVDIVAGTFGGDAYGGGANAVLSVFLVIVSACLLGMWRQGTLSGGKALGGIVLFLTPVFLNSSRVALLYLPIVFFVVFRNDILSQPLRALAGLAVTVVLVVGMLWTHTQLSQTPGTHTWRDLVVNTYEHQLASERERSDNYSGLSRWTVLTFWAEQQRNSSAFEVLLGHGPGATRVQEEGIDLSETLAERKYGSRQIGYTAVAALLWEVGIVGLLVMLALLWAGFRQAGSLARHHTGCDGTKAGIMRGLQAGIVILTLSLAHKDFLVFHAGYQTLLACVLGYLAAQMNLARYPETAHETRPRSPERVGWR